VVWIQGTSANVGRGLGGEIGTSINVDRSWVSELHPGSQTSVPFGSRAILD